MPLVLTSVNQGQEEQSKDHHDRIMAVIKRFDDLSPIMYIKRLWQS
jgi:hypothetical protein